MHTLPRKESYREFCSKIAPSKHPFLGITLPILHHYSRSLSAKEKKDWLKKIPHDLKNAEEGLVAGDILSIELKTTPTLLWWDLALEYLQWCDSWNYIDNLFCAIKWIKIQKYSAIYQELNLLLLKGLDSHHPFVLRFVILTLSRYYPQNHQILLKRFEDFSDTNEYYLKMGIAWALSEMYLGHEEMIYSFLEKKTLSPWIFSQTISKIISSKQVSLLLKEKIKKLRKAK